MSNMSPDDNDTYSVAGLAGLYALDALEGDDLERFEAYLATNAEAREEVAGFRATAARLGEMTATAPPAGLRDRVMHQVSVTRQEAPVVQLDERRAARARRRAVLGAVAAVAVLIAGVGGYLIGDRTAPAPTDVAALLTRPDTKVVPLTGIGSDVAAGQVVVAPGVNKVVVVSDKMPPSNEGRTYELWKVDAAGVHAAGLFAPVNGKVRAALDVDLQGATKFLITDEPEGGSPKATTDPLMEASLA
ncbi:MAG: anti-sigma factor [Acidimicrobiales bacterium]